MWKLWWGSLTGWDIKWVAAWNWLFWLIVKKVLAVDHEWIVGLVSNFADRFSMLLFTCCSWLCGTNISSIVGWLWFGFNSCTISKIGTKIWYKVKDIGSQVKAKFISCWKLGFSCRSIMMSDWFQILQTCWVYYCWHAVVTDLVVSNSISLEVVSNN